MRNFVLDPDHELSIKDCLRLDSIQLSPSQMSAFVSDIREDIATFEGAKKATTRFRETHNQLQRLWEVAAGERPQPKSLQGAISDLSGDANAYVNRRFPNVAERVLGEQPKEVDFKNWAQTACAETLAHVSRLLTAEGANKVQGRSRGRGKRARPRVAPMVMGVTRGGSTGAPHGGRPNNQLRIDLVMHLALTWLRATEKKPKRGRGDETGFGALVFHVFGWLHLLDEEKDESGVHALRQYWSMVPNDDES
jgi:hypothetical protein